jgi:uncharacterized protein
LSVFADSGGWISIAVPADRHHEAGTRYFQRLVDGMIPVVTTDFVLDEVITRLRYDADHRTAMGFIARIHRAQDCGALRVQPVTQEIWSRAVEIFHRYDDVKLSFTDCTSFAFLETHPVDEVFGYDSHFEMMGHILKPK